MIHDPKVEVTCDGKGCQAHIPIEPEYTYNNYSGDSGQYECGDDAIEERLESRRWVVQDGKHYCCNDCAGIEEEETE